MDSILTSIKKLLGITEDYNHFDSDIVMYINSSFSTLTQLGVGPKNGFTIVDSKTTWEDYLVNRAKLEFIKVYIYLKVKMLFDPPSNPTVIDSIKNQINELEWRINVAIEDV